MLKLIGLACTAILLLFVAKPQSDKFSKYKTVEAYEIRPGILMVPTYSTDGQVCEIGIERRHYMPDKVTLSSGLSREEINQICDELAPVNERGSRPTNLLERGGVMQEGNTLLTSEEYENVSISIYSEALSASSGSELHIKNVAATITWKHRKCNRGAD